MFNKVRLNRCESRIGKLNYDKIDVAYYNWEVAFFYKVNNVLHNNWNHIVQIIVDFIKESSLDEADGV